MPGIDGFVIFKCVIADFMELVSIKVGTLIIDCAVGPVLSVPVFAGAIDLRGFWNWSVYFCIPLAQIKDGVKGREGVIVRILRRWFEYV